MSQETPEEMSEDMVLGSQSEDVLFLDPGDSSTDKDNNDNDVLPVKVQAKDGGFSIEDATLDNMVIDPLGSFLIQKIRGAKNPE